MNCNHTELREKITAWLDDELTPQEKEAVQTHLATCTICAEEMKGIKRMRDILGEVPVVEPPTNALNDFNAMLARETGNKNNSRSLTIHYSWQRIAAAILLFILGTTTGFLIKPGNNKQSESIARLENNLTEMRQMLMYAMINQDAPSERLKGVYYAEELSQQPGEEVTGVLLKTLNNDPNVNVRLAAANALARFTSSSEVIPALVNSLKEQKDPLIQIVLIKTLVEAHAQSAIPALRQLTTGEDIHEMVRQEAKNGLTILL